jgi:hypothetical protein
MPGIFVFILVIAVLGFAVWLLGQIEMDPTFSKILRATAIFVLVILIILGLLGFVGIGPGVRWVHF